MIRVVRLSLLVLLSATAASAQQMSGMDHSQHMAQKPTLDAELAEHFKGITLTDAQIRQVTEIKTKHHRAIDALRANPAGRDSATVAAEVKQHMEAEHAEFMALLTPEQKKQFEENMRAHHPAPAARPAMDHGAHGNHDMGKAPTKAPEPRRP